MADNGPWLSWSCGIRGKPGKQSVANPHLATTMDSCILKPKSKLYPQWRKIVELWIGISLPLSICFHFPRDVCHLGDIVGAHFFCLMHNLIKPFIGTGQIERCIIGIWASGLINCTPSQLRKRWTRSMDYNWSRRFFEIYSQNISAVNLKFLFLFLSLLVQVCVLQQFDVS